MPDATAETSTTTPSTQIPAPNAPSGSAEEKKSFTQSELDALFKPRTDEARVKGQRDLIESLGVKDADELKSILDKFKDLESKQLTEKEKLEKELASERTKREAADQKRKESEARANEKLIRAAFLSEASKPVYKFQEEAIPDLWALLSTEQRESLKLNDDDTVENLSAVVKQMAENKKHLLKQDKPAGPGTPRPAGNGTRPGEPGQEDAARAAFARTIRGW